MASARASSRRRAVPLTPRRATWLASRRAAWLAPVLAISLGGCSAAGSVNTTTNAVTATATTSGLSGSGGTSSAALTIYISDPPAVQSDQALQDVVSAERLAFQGAEGTFRHGSLALKVLTQPKISDNARNAIADESVVAYLGELRQGQSAQTVGITNAQDVLEFSATDTSMPTKANFESDAEYGRTFASLPSDLGTSSAALMAADPQFRANFRQHYMHAPSPQAIDGYVTMRVLLRVLVGTRGTANNRQEIVQGVLHTLSANRGSADVANFTLKYR